MATAHADRKVVTVHLSRAAQMLGVHESTARGWLAMGLLRPAISDGRRAVTIESILDPLVQERAARVRQRREAKRSPRLGSHGATSRPRLRLIIDNTR